MAIESAFRELFSETVTLYPSTAQDIYGKYTYVAASAAVTASAHYSSERELLRDADGREVVQTGKIYLYGVFTVDETYKLVLDDGTEPPIIGVDQPHDQNGAHHTVIRVGEMKR